MPAMLWLPVAVHCDKWQVDVGSSDSGKFHLCFFSSFFQALHRRLIATHIDSDNTEEIKAKSEALTNAIYKVSEKMYAQAAQQQQADQGAQQAQGQNSDGTYDADFTEVDDNK